MSSTSTDHYIPMRAVLVASALFISTGFCKYIVPLPEPDKTGTVDFPGFRLDRPWPGNWDDQVAPSSWSLQINASRDVRSWYPSYTYGESTNTAIAVQLALPRPDTPGSFVSMTNQGPSSNATRSWQVSMMAFGPINLATVADPNDVENGTCPASVVSKDCADQIKLRIRGSIPVMHAELPEVSLNHTICPVVASASYRVKKLELNHDKFNESATVVWQYDQGKYPNAYDDFGSRTFPVVVVWGHTGDAYGGEELDGAGLAADHVQIVCVKADSSSRMVTVNAWTAGVTFLVAVAWGSAW